jgi:hypothetical protein
MRSLRFNVAQIRLGHLIARHNLSSLESLRLVLVSLCRRFELIAGGRRAQAVAAMPLQPYLSYRSFKMGSVKTSYARFSKL